MTYTDALDFLRIANNAYDCQAYDEAAQILERVAYYAAGANDLKDELRDTLVEGVQHLIGRFHFCPVESLWEETCQLSDLFRK